MDAAIGEMKRIDADYLAPEISMLDAEALSRSWELDVRLLPWTVNDREDLQRLLRHDTVAGAITDKPRIALGLRRMIGAARPL